MQLSALRGRPVVLTFWGTWCQPCREEFPALVAARRRHSVAQLEVVAVNQRDQELSTKSVQTFVTEYHVDFPVLLDARGVTRRRFQLVGLPTTLFVDAAGVVQRVHIGAMDTLQLAHGLALILPP